MGMFDYVDCDYPLPDRPDWAAEFQTKDLDCELDHWLRQIRCPPSLLDAFSFSCRTCRRIIARRRRAGR